MEMVRFFGAIVICLVIFVGFGGTYVAMATDRENGYPTATSAVFNSVYMNGDNASKYIGQQTTIAYNLQQKVDASKYNSNLLNFMYTIIRDIAGTIFDDFTFAKNMLITVIGALGIPPMIFGAIVSMLTIVLAIYVARAVFGRDL